MTHVIAVANHKGGSGKTTSTYYLGLAFAGMGKSTLLIDLDDQATLTSRLHSGLAPATTIADVLAGEHLAKAVCEYRDEALESVLGYVTADHRLAWVAAQMQAASPNHAFLCRGWQSSRLQPQIVLIDCPPSAGVLLINALALASHVVIPSTPTEESYAGLLRMERMVDDITAILNHPISILGNLITMTSPASLSEQYYIDLLQASSLGSVPRRVGRTAHDQLMSAYADIAETIVGKLETTRPCSGN
jgi:chromosome partitioning protein